MGQPTFQDKIQELNTDFAKICITPRPSGSPVARVPLPVLKELELQARQNISTLNFTAAFAKTSSSCNASLEKCQHSIKSTVKKIKSQIQKGANPEKAAKRGYEEVADYLELCPPPWGVDILFLLFSPSDVRRPMSGVTHGFRSFKGKVLELLSPNLVCRLIGSIACLGLLLAVVPLLLTE